MAVQTRRRCPRHANRTSAFRTSVVSSTVRRLSGSPRCTPKQSPVNSRVLLCPLPSVLREPSSELPSFRHVEGGPLLSPVPPRRRGKYKFRFFQYFE